MLFQSKLRLVEDPVRLESMVSLPPSLEAGLGHALIEHAKSRAIVAL